MSFEQRPIKVRQCYICFKKFEMKPTQQTKCCSDECKKKYREYMHERAEDGREA